MSSECEQFSLKSLLRLPIVVVKLRIIISYNSCDQSRPSFSVIIVIIIIIIIIIIINIIIIVQSAYDVNDTIIYLSLFTTDSGFLSKYKIFLRIRS